MKRRSHKRRISALADPESSCCTTDDDEDDEDDAKKPRLQSQPSQVLSPASSSCHSGSHSGVAPADACTSPKTNGVDLDSSTASSATATVKVLEDAMSKHLPLSKGE